jgi:hypothetical protein
MSRREIVLLVSRAVAILSAIEALIHLSNLPYQAFLMVRQYLRSLHGGPQNYLVPEEWMVILLILVRVIGLLLIAGLFWRCGPMVEEFLLSESTQEKPDTSQ